MSNILWVAFIVKHFICDFPLQKPRHFLNKGTYGHLGGIEHAWIHTIGTIWVICWLGLPTNLFFFAAIIDFIVHYHVDWFKMWWTAKKGYTPQDEMFWIWLGIDQMIHYLTYALIIEIICP